MYLNLIDRRQMKKCTKTALKKQTSKSSTILKWNDYYFITWMRQSCDSIELFKNCFFWLRETKAHSGRINDYAQCHLRFMISIYNFCLRLAFFLMSPAQALATESIFFGAFTSINLIESAYGKMIQKTFIVCRILKMKIIISSHPL